MEATIFYTLSTILGLLLVAVTVYVIISGRQRKNNIDCIFEFIKKLRSSPQPIYGLSGSMQQILNDKGMQILPPKGTDCEFAICSFTNVSHVPNTAFIAKVEDVYNKKESETLQILFTPRNNAISTWQVIEVTVNTIVLQHQIMGKLSLPIGKHNIKTGECVKLLQVVKNYTPTDNQYTLDYELYGKL